MGRGLAEPATRRHALACTAAMLVAYVGAVHEVVGAKLYPTGPAELGGPLAWHATGGLGIAAGLLLVAGTLGLLRVPVVPLAAAASAAGIFFVVWDAVLHGGFHFFAFTVAAAGAAVAALGRP